MAVLPSLFINMAVPVNFFHLERALGSGLAEAEGGPASTLPFSGIGGGEDTPPLLLLPLAVTATVGMTAVVAAKIVIGGNSLGRKNHCLVFQCYQKTMTTNKGIGYGKLQKFCIREGWFAIAIISREGL